METISARPQSVQRVFSLPLWDMSAESDWRVVNFADTVPTQAQTVHLNFTQLPFRRHTIERVRRELDIQHMSLETSACTSLNKLELSRRIYFMELNW